MAYLEDLIIVIIFSQNQLFRMCVKLLQHSIQNYVFLCQLTISLLQVGFINQVGLVVFAYDPNCKVLGLCHNMKNIKVYSFL